MARYTGPKVRLSRKFGEDIFGNTTKRMQGRNQNVRRRKSSEYGIMLAEKQKAKLRLYAKCSRRRQPDCR